MCDNLLSAVTAGDQSAIHVQSEEGDIVSTIDTPEALDAAMSGCNRKGIRERALLTALKHDLGKLKEQLRSGSSDKDAETEVAHGADTDADKPALQASSQCVAPLLDICSCSAISRTCPVKAKCRALL